MAKYDNFNDMNRIARQIMVGATKKLVEKGYSLNEIAVELDMSDNCVREISEIIDETTKAKKTSGRYPWVDKH